MFPDALLGKKDGRDDKQSITSKFLQSNLFLFPFLSIGLTRESFFFSRNTLFKKTFLLTIHNVFRLSAANKIHLHSNCSDHHPRAEKRHVSKSSNTKKGNAKNVGILFVLNPELRITWANSTRFPATGRWIIYPFPLTTVRSVCHFYFVSLRYALKKMMFYILFCVYKLLWDVSFLCNSGQVAVTTQERENPINFSR